jgi:pimeloyl-ACP methyl ester carboxylesterase
MINQKQIVIDGLVSSYTEAGEGEPVLLLHGWGCSAAIFKDMQTELSKDFRVFAVDFPGFGKSDEPHEVWASMEYADWTETLVRKLNINTPAVLGHSFGGKIAQILNSKIAIRKLILTGSAGLILDADIKKRKGNSKYNAVKNVLEGILPKPLFDKIKEKMIETIGSADYKSANPHMRNIMKQVIAEDVRDYAEKIAVPTLLIWGENDKDTPPEMGQTLHTIIPDSQLEVFPACGHYAFLDNKVEFLNLTRNFLKHHVC